MKVTNFSFSDDNFAQRRGAAKTNRLVRRVRVVIEGPMTEGFQGPMWEATVEGSQPLQILNFSRLK